MGEYQSTKWILVGMMWLVIGTFLAIGGEQVADYYGLNQGYNYTNSTFQDAMGLDKCDDPRNAWVLQNNFYTTGREIGTLENNCQFTLGIAHQDVCDSIEGCLWDNATTGWWIFQQVTEFQSCFGDVNTTFYNNNVTPGLFDSICEFDSVQPDQGNLCTVFGCKTYSYESIQQENAVTSVWTTVKNLTTFSLDLGIDNQILKALLSIFAFYIPLAILAFGLRWLLPF